MLIYLLYRLLGTLAFPLLLLYLLRRGLRDRRYWRGLRERFGASGHPLEATVPGGIWLHAVSVGEVMSAIALLGRLRAELPGTTLSVSVSTVAGREIAEQKLGGLADRIFYAPLDYCWIVRRVLRRLRPRVVVVMETEIWPNLYAEARRSGCGLVVVNGRISDRAWPRYRKLRWFFEPVLANPHAILAQNEIAAERYRQLGAPAARVHVAGNLKYDFEREGLRVPAAIQGFCEQTRPETVWIAASTMPPAAEGDADEDDAVIEAFQQLASRHPGLLLLLVPRRPERFSVAEEKLQRAGVRYALRSRLPLPEPLRLPGVLLVDSMGELTSLFALADVVFMGGTLAHRGGHNILEPAFEGRPIVCGPHMENFPDIAEAFRAAGGYEEIAGAQALAPAIDGLLREPARRKQLGVTARRLAESRRGATLRAMESVLAAYDDAVPCPARPRAARLLLRPLAWAWRAGAVLDRRRKQRSRSRLATPVVSVGGLSMGGTGKTPMVAWLAGRFAESGQQPAILTRGYGRRTFERETILSPGERAPVELTGDEAQILLRRGTAVVGIGADRHSVGQQVEQRFGPGVFLLDDGFQHWRLERSVDLVLIDSHDPLGGGAVFPEGRLREPLSSLERATAVVVSRAGRRTPWPGLERRIRNAAGPVPIFYSRVRPEGWVEPHGAGLLELDDLRGEAAAAFCGLGNPASFWATLHAVGIRPRMAWAFPDHTRYSHQQIQWLVAETARAGCGWLLTTEKDMANLPSEIEIELGPIRLLWLKASMELEDADTLWALINERMLSRKK